MKEDRIKSALELALERASQMDRLTPEEAEKLKEKEFQPRGTGIARRYLGNTLRAADLKGELQKYQGKEGEIVRKAFLLALCQAISIGNLDLNAKILEGVQAVDPESNLSGVRKELEALSRDFREQREQKYLAYEERAVKKLRSLGISGSAVRPNLEADEEWQREIAEFASAFEARIDKLRQDLIHQRS